MLRSSVYGVSKEKMLRGPPIGALTLYNKFKGM